MLILIKNLRALVVIPHYQPELIRNVFFNYRRKVIDNRTACQYGYYYKDQENQVLPCAPYIIQRALIRSSSPLYKLSLDKTKLDITVIKVCPQEMNDLEITIGRLFRDVNFNILPSKVTHWDFKGRLLINRASPNCVYFPFQRYDEKLYSYTFKTFLTELETSDASNEIQIIMHDNFYDLAAELYTQTHRSLIECVPHLNVANLEATNPTQHPALVSNQQTTATQLHPTADVNQHDSLIMESPRVPSISKRSFGNNNDRAVKKHKRKIVETTSHPSAFETNDLTTRSEADGNAMIASTTTATRYNSNHSELAFHSLFNKNNQPDTRPQPVIQVEDYSLLDPTIIDRIIEETFNPRNKR